MTGTLDADSFICLKEWIPAKANVSFSAGGSLSINNLLIAQHKWIVIDGCVNLNISTLRV